MFHPATQLPPGFRFHPTDEELIIHYLKNRTAAPSPSPVSIIAEVDIYKFDPWDLPEKAMFGDREWYFFSPRDRKYPNGVRPNRAAVSGYWKATGTDKAICSGDNNVGVKKALVFYRGKPPKGLKTNWIMHEYRLAESRDINKYRPMSTRITDHSMRLDDWVLCRIYKKSRHLPPPVIDQEQEESCADDACFPTQNLVQQHTLQKLPKTSTISEFLEDFSQISNVFDNPLINLPRFDKNPLIGHPISSLQQINHDSIDANAYLLPQLSQIESPDSLNLKHAERNSKEESNESLQYYSKRLNESNIYQSFSGQFDNSHEYSLLNQPFFSQQLLINSHLGLQ